MFKEIAESSAISLHILIDIDYRLLTRPWPIQLKEYRKKLVDNLNASQ
jgi:hypothetical protein